MHGRKVSTARVAHSKLRSRMLTLAHEGHLGVIGTKQNLCSRFRRDAEI